MTKYLLDTNAILRFLLKDNKSQAEIVRTYFKKAEEGVVMLRIASIVLAETVYVLFKLYGATRKDIYQKLAPLLSLEFLDIEKRDIARQALMFWPENSVSFVDMMIIYEAMNSDSHIVTFDKKLIKLASRIKKENITN